jgi:NNP family nitrate/nitrite transporter-like MFS transporter
LTFKTGNAAYLGFIIFYAMCFAVTWAVYIRRGNHTLEGV